MFKFEFVYSVAQDDVMMGTLTVRESITFSARLRLPSSFKHEARQKRINDVICELGLEKCADTKVRLLGQPKEVMRIVKSSAISDGY